MHIPNSAIIRSSVMPQFVADVRAATMLGIAVPVGQSASTTDVIAWWQRVKSIANRYLRTRESQVNLTALAVLLLAKSNINDPAVAARWPTARTGVEPILLAGQGQPGIIFD